MYLIDFSYEIITCTQLNQDNITGHVYRDHWLWTQILTYCSSDIWDFHLKIVSRTHALFLFHGCINSSSASKETRPENDPSQQKI